MLEIVFVQWLKSFCTQFLVELHRW